MKWSSEASWGAINLRRRKPPAALWICRVGEHARKDDRTRWCGKSRQEHSRVGVSCAGALHIECVMMECSPGTTRQGSGHNAYHTSMRSFSTLSCEQKCAWRRRVPCWPCRKLFSLAWAILNSGIASTQTCVVPSSSGLAYSERSPLVLLRRVHWVNQQSRPSLVQPKSPPNPSSLTLSFPLIPALRLHLHVQHEHITCCLLYHPTIQPTSILTHTSLSSISVISPTIQTGSTPAKGSHEHLLVKVSVLISCIQRHHQPTSLQPSTFPVVLEGIDATIRRAIHEYLG